MWIVTVAGAGTVAFYVRKLRAALRETARHTNADRALADWCRHTHVTVITHTGTEFTISLAELQANANPSRSWNVPVSVAIWSTLAQDNAHA
jgi:hypothetical protein